MQQRQRNSGLQTESQESEFLELR